MIKLFTPLEIKPTLTIKNRMVMPPMCMYSAKEFTGQVNDTHLIHYGARALGQIGLIIVEATGVSENGKITDNCLGLYDDNQIEGFSHLVKTCQSYGAKMAVQLIHSGRKSTTKHTTHYGASEIEFNNQPLDYVSMTKQQIKETVQDFKNAAIRADKAGFDAIELHGAHGYLIHQFLSPLSNQRTDEYGQDRHLFLKEIIREIKSVWPKEKGFWIRLSGTDWHEDGLNVNDIIRLVNEIKNDIDLVHVSSGGLINVPIDLYPGYQIPLAREIKKATGLPVFGVGLLTEADHIISLVQEDIVDGVAIGRELLRNPNFGLEIARKVQKHHPEAQIIPSLYERSFK